jgi:hypothetical protein
MDLGQRKVGQPGVNFLRRVAHLMISHNAAHGSARSDNDRLAAGDTFDLRYVWMLDLNGHRTPLTHEALLPLFVILPEYPA